jgi:hypothetical protein
MEDDANSRIVQASALGPANFFETPVLPLRCILALAQTDSAPAQTQRDSTLPPISFTGDNLLVDTPQFAVDRRLQERDSSLYVMVWALSNLECIRPRA